MPFARGDMRVHIVSHKNDHGASYGRYAVLQWWSRLKISFCEIFGVVQFSTFATKSTQNGHAGEPIIRAGVYRTEPVLVRSCCYRRTRRPSPAQDGARVAASAGEC